jgi:hypothetical protein
MIARFPDCDDPCGSPLFCDERGGWVSGLVRKKPTVMLNWQKGTTL